MKFWKHNLIDVENLQRGKTEKYLRMKISRGLQKKTYCKFHHESVHDAAHHCDEIKCIPGVFKVALGERKYILKASKEFYKSTRMSLCNNHVANMLNNFVTFCQ